MSYYERHKGTIERVYFAGSIEEFAESLNLGKLPDYYDDWGEYFREYFREELSDEYIIYNGNIFKVNNTEEDASNDIFEYNINGGKIEYQFSFYNGGTCLYEQLMEVLEKAEIQEETEIDDFIFKDDIESVSYSDDFWYALTNGYIDLDNILVNNDAKNKLIDAIDLVESFQYKLESSDFFEEM
jgi:hypothetical protein